MHLVKPEPGAESAAFARLTGFLPLLAIAVAVSTGDCQTRGGNDRELW